ncbi:acyl carrier protein [Nocardiopsis trehalosi]|jgi:acyl carrier protein|uniref:acyl carrier protein n=1 Tax=Nocardiopsis trehalosi TaxID=109329 RepID=UPI00082C6B54|nr:acyl carrier protein [Nocardiopsis trehalosi]
MPIGTAPRRDAPATRDDLTRLLRGVCAAVLAVDRADVTDAALLAEDLEADSLDTAEIAGVLRSHGVPITAREAAAARTFADLVALAHARAAGGA